MLILRSLRIEQLKRQIGRNKKKRQEEKLRKKPQERLQKQQRNHGLNNRYQFGLLTGIPEASNTTNS